MAHNSWIRRLRRTVALHLFLAFLLIYGISAGVSLRRHSLAAHFVYLAEAFLNGRLDLIHIPNPPYDLTPFNGRWYVSFPPLPALLLAPLVAIWGLSVSDIAFSVVVGAGSVAVFYVALARLERTLGLGESLTLKLWLCLLFGLGTPLWYCAALGSVWYTAHVVGVLCLCLYMLEALGRNRPGLAGLWLGLAFLARAPIVLAFPLALVCGLARSSRWKERLFFIGEFVLGLAPAVVGQAVYNWARFGNALEMGYRWMNSPSTLQERMLRWGQFSLHFIPENLYTLTIRPPLVSWKPLRIQPDPWGMGLLFTTPALLLAFPQLRRPLGYQLPALASLWVGLWGSIGLVLLPSLLYFNTGSYQFGYRFALDWLPLAIAALVLARGGQLPRWGRLLILFSALTHGWGLLWMYPNFNGEPWIAQYLTLLRTIVQR